MTKWIYKWRRNGYISCSGREVTNADLFEQLDHDVLDLNAVGVQIQFWWVSRDNNRQADQLANNALDGC